MKPYLIKTPRLLQWLFPRRVWAFSRKKPTIYLTFDDGPIPEVTPWVLAQLKKYNAKATFFCIGDNVKKYPKIFQSIIDHGHGIGNHTFHHLKGTETTTEKYLEDITLFEETVTTLNDEARETSDESPRHSLLTTPTSLFRPPYGKMTSSQARKVVQRGYKIVMWDVLSADFDTSISEKKCLQNVLKNLQNGSIIVFHDSVKAEKNLRYVLPKVLGFAANRRYNVERF